MSVGHVGHDTVVGCIVAIGVDFSAAFELLALEVSIKDRIVCRSFSIRVISAEDADDEAGWGSGLAVEVVAAVAHDAEVVVLSRPIAG